jgi:hypothetical protein
MSRLLLALLGACWLSPAARGIVPADFAPETVAADAEERYRRVEARLREEFAAPAGVRRRGDRRPARAVRGV